MARQNEGDGLESKPRAVHVVIEEGRAMLDDAYNALPDLRPERIRENAVSAATTAANKAFSDAIEAMKSKYA
jgi:hypothetical protein